MMRKLVILVVICRRRRPCGVLDPDHPGDRAGERARQPHAPNLANGKTMFHAGGCASCHATPEQDDKTRLGGGLALKSPFGTFYVPNISPDPNDGIGGWNEAQFVTAMTKGTSPDGRHYYPAFPYTSYQRMRIDDLRDLFAFLKTLPAVQGKVRDHDLPFPFNIRRTLGGWKLLFLDGKPFQPDPARPRNGTAAPIWSTGPAIAPSATARATCSAASSRASASPAAPTRKARAGSPTSRRRAWRLFREGHRLSAGDRRHAERRFGRRRR